MKNLIYILVFTFPLTAFAQNLERIPPITAPVKQNPPIPKYVHRGYYAPPYNFLYVVDGVPIGNQNDLVLIDPEHVDNTTAINQVSTAQVFCRPLDGVILVTLKNDVDLHSIEVIAHGFEGFLATQPSKDFYSEKLLKDKNTLMVKEWNRRCKRPKQYSPTYGTPIAYDAEQEYGLDIEYRLFMFFKFMEKENGISLGIG